MPLGPGLLCGEAGGKSRWFAFAWTAFRVGDPELLWRLVLFGVDKVPGFHVFLRYTLKYAAHGDGSSVYEFHFLSV